MQSLTLAYRDDNRTPVIFAIGEIATIEYPEAQGLNPLSLWDLHWVKQLDDAGFIDPLAQPASR